MIHDQFSEKLTADGLAKISRQKRYELRKVAKGLCRVCTGKQLEERDTVKPTSWLLVRGIVPKGKRRHPQSRPLRSPSLCWKRSRPLRFLGVDRLKY